MEYSLKEYIESREGIMVSCFVATMVILKKSNLIKYPRGYSIPISMGSAMIGYKVSDWIPNWLKSYVSTGVLSLSFVGLIYKRITNYDNDDDTSFSEESDDTVSDKSQPQSQTQTQTQPQPKTITEAEQKLLDRISYTTHPKIKIEDIGLIIDIEDAISDNKVIHTVEKLYLDNKDTHGKLVADIIDVAKTYRSLNLSKIKGVFVHDDKIGYVLITTNSVTNNDDVMKIRID